MICLYHKTFSTYGEAGKYVPPALLRAFELYSKMRKLVPEEQLDPVSFFLVGKPQVAKLLSKFGKVSKIIKPGQKVTPTFIRKYQVTSVGELACQPT